MDNITIPKVALYAFCESIADTLFRYVPATPDIRRQWLAYHQVSMELSLHGHVDSREPEIGGALHMMHKQLEKSVMEWSEPLAKS